MCFKITRAQIASVNKTRWVFLCYYDNSFNQLGNVNQETGPYNTLHDYLILLRLIPGRFLNIGLKVFLKIIFYSDPDRL